MKTGTWPTDKSDGVQSLVPIFPGRVLGWEMSIFHKYGSGEYSKVFENVYNRAGKRKPMGKSLSICTGHLQINEGNRQ